MALVLFFIITANVMQKTEVDQNLLVFFRQLIAGVLAIKKSQYKYPQDMFDAMVLKQMLLRIAQRRSNSAESKKVLCDGARSFGTIASVDGIMSSSCTVSLVPGLRITSCSAR